MEIVEGIKGTPHGRRRGWLKNGNPPGDLSQGRRCGAKNRQGKPCRCPAMQNGRCRLHGGLSTGPRSLAGIESRRTTQRPLSVPIVRAGQAG